MLVLPIEGFIKYAAELGLRVMIYIPSFIQSGSGIQKLLGVDTYTDTHIEQGGHISLLLFFFSKRGE
jgi:hypothetical protein